MYIQKEKKIPILDDYDYENGYIIYQFIELENGSLVVSTSKGIKLFKFNGSSAYELDKHFDIPFKNEHIIVVPIKHKYILFVVDNGNIMVEHNNIYHEIKCSNESIDVMILLNNGNLLTCSHKMIRIWKIVYLTKIELNMLYEFKNECYINCIVELLDGTIVTGDDNGCIKFWIGTTCINEILIEGNQVTCLSILHDGKLIYGTLGGNLVILK